LAVAIAAVGSGIALDVGIRGGPTNLIVVLGIGLAVLALVVDDHVESRHAKGMALASLVPAAFLAIRVSPWLSAANFLLALALLTTAICTGQSGSVFDTTPQRMLRRAVRALAPASMGPIVLRPLVPTVATSAASRLARMVLAVSITLPLVLILVALLASADAVFAGLLVPDVDLTAIPGHVVLSVLATGAVLGAVSAARHDFDDRPLTGRFGAIEVATMLGLAALVMALFAVAQLVALTSAGERLVEEAGLTPAEYARTGFFQLCWAAALIVGFLTVVRALAAPSVLEQPAIKALSAAVPLLTLGLVVVSLRRMALYDEAFGLTMLRLSVVAAALWMGTVLVMLAARNLGIGAGRDWVVSGALVTALVLVVGGNVGNAEAFVVRHNVDRATHDGAELDAAYLRNLSDDALPAYVDAMSDGPASIRRELSSAAACGPVDDDSGYSDTPNPEKHISGARALNLSVATANPLRDGLCKPPTSPRY
jgi:hypothetical protein